MRKKLIIIFGILTVALVAALLWPTASYDMSRVHPSLRDLATPYQSVSAGYFLDGGSISITIVDRTAHKLELALPVSYEHRRSYPRLFVGAEYMTRTGAVEIAFSEDTRRMLIAVVEEQCQPIEDREIVLVSIRGAPRDHAHLWSRAAIRLCQWWAR